MSNYQSGYSCEFVEKLPKQLQSECPVCLLVLREPYQVNCCGYAFCRTCIERIQSDSKPCPCCKREKFDMFEDKRLKRSLYEYKVHCSNSQQGCQWVGELGQLDNHLNLNPSQHNQLQGCQLSQIKCLHCSQLFLRSDIEIHQSKLCPIRPVRCGYCEDFSSSYEEVAANHWPVCGSYPLPCTNKCGQTLQRQNLDNHIANDCPLTIIDCDFQHVGCKVRLPRKDMLAHLGESVVNHLSLQSKDMAKSYEQMQKRINSLHQENDLLKQQIDQVVRDNKALISKEAKSKADSEQEIRRMTETITDLQLSIRTLEQEHQYSAQTVACPCKLTLENFTQKKKNEVWTSPPFYSHLKGYKVCLRVIANNWYPIYGTYVTTQIQLLTGEYDHRLRWPLKGEVHVTLKSQNKDEEKNYKEIINIDFNMPEHGRTLRSHDVHFSHKILLPSHKSGNRLVFLVRMDSIAAEYNR